jgi:hypothetical protein
VREDGKCVVVPNEGRRTGLAVLISASDKPWSLSSSWTFSGMGEELEMREGRGTRRTTGTSMEWKEEVDVVEGRRRMAETGGCCVDEN